MARSLAEASQRFSGLAKWSQGDRVIVRDLGSDRRAPTAEAIFGAIEDLDIECRGVIHGDLHLGNLLITDQTRFCWVDPRGSFGRFLMFDFAYDVAKLLHEPHYVAVRTKAVSGLQLSSSNSLVIGLTKPTVRSARVLGTVASLSQQLAALAVQHHESDRALAARATFLAGLQFMALQRFAHFGRSQREAYLACGLRWLSAGIEAVRSRSDLPECQAIWAGLMADISTGGRRR